ncbi:hypothetical protein WL71_25920 [Burkholderia ubonensis]|nr:hypothetical protein WL70_32705 [Burkholderia ubonensis]KWD77937.1 hypothetical protein WL71_25920 [Burkholderia ubonensis]KWD98961.1 hypothetical protein WL72_16190 [Burkholderia ubonensis]KWN17750.1 hypothetical protein WM21_09035 [Burkholderia ubonensis]
MIHFRLSFDRWPIRKVELPMTAWMQCPIRMKWAISAELSSPMNCLRSFEKTVSKMRRSMKMTFR